jgi:hypothetical protein
MSLGFDPLPVAPLDEVVAHQGDEQEVDERFHAPGILQEDRMNRQWCLPLVVA